jgi:hypothetical protein
MSKQACEPHRQRYSITTCKLHAMAQGPARARFPRHSRLERLRSAGRYYTTACKNCRTTGSRAIPRAARSATIERLAARTSTAPTTCRRGW